ncbi:CyP450 monooxygenase [Lentinus tigrinus ALCF2SS1-7]|uniref:CyP450 monooxygenase n=1 Tax=Lentinus tigrinus ALCF2SS1-6 TaxID=1328759 RepID=A0A5C2S1G7_9APHY|nr:CyP450 monooxygenase [Lentinus tigrinus ALCF2SS1-6]RPD73144.1 CyP450 monooxygenase [Lentinus tigrinus ALCF2SS1-7]
MPASSLALVAFAVLILFYVRSWIIWNSRTRGRPLPPGPRGLPFFGNAIGLRKGRQWLTFNKLREKYGPILYFQVLKQPIVVLCSPEAVLEYMDRRSANTSDRLQSPSILLTGHDWTFGLMPYGPTWRQQRRMFWQHFHPGAIDKYRPVQLASMHTFLAKVASNPGRLDGHIQYTFTAAILKMAYGIDVKDENDELLTYIETGLQGSRELILSGGFLVDFIPILRHLPSFLPGCGFRKKFARWRENNRLLRAMPFQRYKEAVDANKTPECILTDIIYRGDDNSKESHDELARVGNNVMGTIYTAGSDTTASALKTFCLAMSLYPEVQRKAQAQLDAVVGHDRLPGFEDRKSLTYVDAILKESLRWMNVTPLGKAHSTTEDDEFGGYFIPAGSILMANIWACLHDPEIYEDPDVFKPERFIRDGKLDPDVRDPYDFAFGFGRRICPGRFFGDAALFINIAAMLHVFDISPPLDERGEEIAIEPIMSDCIMSRPEDSRCSIKPRGLWAEKLIYSTEGDSLA